MKLQNKLKLILIISLALISISSVVFGKYVLETENKEITNINIKTVVFKISDFSKYGKLDVYINGQKNVGDISSLTKRYNYGSNYEIKNIVVNGGYTLTTDLNSLKGTLSDNTTINLAFSTNTYSISYNLDGGSIVNENRNYNVETDSFTLPIPTKEGFTFTGWTGTGLDTPTINVTIPKGTYGDKTYTANWVNSTYSITYNLNNGTLNNAINSYKSNSENFTLPKPTRNGYSFAGWTGSGLSNPTVDVTIVKGTMGDKSYTANWTPINYSISYNANGGSISGQRTSYNIETGTFNLVTPSRTGYSFTGWTGTGLGWATTTVTIPKGSTGDRGYTANWVDNIRPDIYGAWITSGPTYEVRSTGYGYRVNIQVSCGDSGSGINRVLTYYENAGSWVGETNITGSMTDSFWFKPGYRQIRIVVFDNAGNSSETVIGVQCG